MLFSPYALGHLTLPNRIVMPPMARSRAASGEVATALMAEYYSQRAGAGGVPKAPDQPAGPGLRLDAGHPQRRAGRRLAPGHRRGARRRRAHLRPALARRRGLAHLAAAGNAAPVSSSALVAEGVKVFVDPQGRGRAGGGEMVQHSAPRALAVEEIREIVADYARPHATPSTPASTGRTARRQRLPDQPVHRLPGQCAQRPIPAARWRTAAPSAKSPRQSPRWSARSIGVRLAPPTTLQGAVDDTPQATYLAAARTAGRNRRGLHPSPRPTGKTPRPCRRRSRKRCASSTVAA